MADVQNGRTGHLVIPNIFDGECGVQEGSPLVAAFKPIRGGRRAERATEAELDGVPYQVLSVSRSKITPGFYLLMLEPAE